VDNPPSAMRALTIDVLLGMARDSMYI
jgi:hypothetical protein